MVNNNLSVNVIRSVIYPPWIMSCCWNSNYFEFCEKNQIKGSQNNHLGFWCTWICAFFQTLYIFCLQIFFTSMVTCVRWKAFFWWQDHNYLYEIFWCNWSSKVCIFFFKETPLNHPYSSCITNRIYMLHQVVFSHIVYNNQPPYIYDNICCVHQCNVDLCKMIFFQKDNWINNK